MTHIRQLEFKLRKAERGMGMPYSREDVAHYRRLIAEAKAAKPYTFIGPDGVEYDADRNPIAKAQT